VSKLTDDERSSDLTKLHLQIAAIHEAQTQIDMQNGKLTIFPQFSEARFPTELRLKI
jgi:hypothetical protein